MTRAKYILLPALCALAVAAATPALALNPQPLPPGHQISAGTKYTATSHANNPNTATGGHHSR